MTKESERMRVFVQELMALHQGISVGLRDELADKGGTATKTAFLVGCQATLLMLNRRLEDMVTQGELDQPAEDMFGFWDADQLALSGILIDTIRLADRLFNVNLSKEGWERLWRVLERAEKVAAKKGH